MKEIQATDLEKGMKFIKNDVTYKVTHVEAVINDLKWPYVPELEVWTYDTEHPLTAPIRHYFKPAEKVQVVE